MISDVVALANSKLANIERRQQEALDEALSSIEELRMRIEELENQGMLRIEKLEAQVEAQAASRWTVEQKIRSEEHTSELQSLMRISYAVFCLKKKKNKNQTPTPA